MSYGSNYETKTNVKTKKRIPITSYGILPFYVEYAPLSSTEQKTLEDDSLKENTSECAPFGAHSEGKQEMIARTEKDESSHIIVRFLLIQRRDTFEYMDFVKGIWSENNLLNTFSLLTEDERSRLEHYDIQTLWDDLWIDHTYYIYIEGYTKAKKRYDLVKDRIPQLLKNTVSKVSEPPWGFPKGKKISGEDSKECALREFQEETKIKKEQLVIISDKPYHEQYTGNNDKIYCSYYYLAECKDITIPTRRETPHCIRQNTHSEEIEAVAWVTLDEARAYKLSYQRMELMRRALYHIASRK